MGYQITLKPTEEKMQEYKPWNEEKSPDYTNLYKQTLIHYCMKNDEEFGKKYQSVLMNLRILLNVVKSQVKQEAYYQYKEDGSVWFCGRQYSIDQHIDEEEEIVRVLNNLLILANLVDTPNYFTNKDDFNKKFEEIEEEVIEFEETAREIAIHEIINDLKDSGCEVEEDD